MRITSKLLSVILVMCMLLTTVGFAATYTDVSTDDVNYPAISLLSSLGIIKGYEDGSFGPDRDVTRAEFTVMLIRTLNMSGIGSSDPAGLPFEDIDSVDWAISDIRTAYDLGIINGMSETVFAPNDNVTNEQALKMIVCAMGYEPMAIDTAGGADKVWPSGYTTVASKLNINTGVASAYTAPAKRVEIANYIYNSLETDLMVTTEYPNGAVKTEIKTGVNILNDKLKVYFGNGELRADTETTVEASGALAREGEVIIYENDEAKNDIFAVNDIVTKGLVGRSIKYYYKLNSRGDKSLIHIEDTTNSASILSILPDSINDVTGSWSGGVKVSYWETEDARNPVVATIAANPVVSINGRVVNNNNVTPTSAFTFDSGSIELIASASSSYYDKVNIVKYETYVVGSTSTTSKMIIDLYKTTVDGNTFVLDEDDIKTTINMTKASNGSSVSLAGLAKYNVLSIKESTGSNGKSVIEVIVSTEKISGAITGLDLTEKEISVNSKTYKLSNYLLKYAETQVDQLEINDNCDLYLDKDGNVAAIEKSTSTNTAYAYIIKAAVTDDEIATFRIYDSTGVKILNAANRVRVDGEPFSNPDDLVEHIIDVSDNTEGSQLVKLTKNSSGLITAIDTVEEADNESDTDLKLAISGTDFAYNSSSRTFKKGSDSFIVDTNTLFIAVPENPTDYTEYSKRSLSYFKNGKTYDNLIEVYDLGNGSADSAKCVVIYGEGGAETLTAASPLLIVSSASDYTTNDKGEQVRSVSGYLFGEGLSNTQEIKQFITTDMNVLSDAETGDVYRIAYTDGTDINGNSAEVITVSGEMDSSLYQWGIPGDSDDDYRVYHGLLMGASDDSFVIAQTHDIDDLIEENEYDQHSLRVTSSTVFVTYDATQNKYNMLVTGTDNILSTMPSFDDTKQFIVRDEDDNVTDTTGVNATEILAYMVNDRIVLVYQIIR